MAISAKMTPTPMTHPNFVGILATSSGKAEIYNTNPLQNLKPKKRFQIS